jgi:lipase
MNQTKRWRHAVRKRALNEPVIFIHGLMNGLSHLDAIGHFAQRRVLIPDLLGYGANQGDSVIVDLHSQVAFIDSLLDRERIDRAHLVGHSVGGAIAILFARKHPKRVASIVNVEGNFTLKDAFWSRKIAAMTTDEVVELLARDADDIAEWLSQNHIEPTPERMDWTKGMFEASPPQTIHAVARSVIEITSRPDYLRDVQEVFDDGIAMHLLAGERSLAGWDVPEFVRDRAVSFQIQPRVGHMMMLEEPEEFLELVGRALG